MTIYDDLLTEIADLERAGIDMSQARYAVEACIRVAENQTRRYTAAEGQPGRLASALRDHANAAPVGGDMLAVAQRAIAQSRRQIG